MTMNLGSGGPVCTVLMSSSFTVAGEEKFEVMADDVPARVRPSLVRWAQIAGLSPSHTHIFSASGETLCFPAHIIMQAISLLIRYVPCTTTRLDNLESAMYTLNKSEALFETMIHTFHLIFEQNRALYTLHLTVPDSKSGTDKDMYQERNHWGREIRVTIPFSKDFFLSPSCLMQGLTPLVTSCRAMQKASTYLCEATAIKYNQTVLNRQII
jgi:hypothetical protein